MVHGLPSVFKTREDILILMGEGDCQEVTTSHILHKYKKKPPYGYLPICRLEEHLIVLGIASLLYRQLV
jgi:hypothetical protein